MAINNGIQEKSIVSDNVLDRSVQSPPDFQTIPGSDTFVINISSFADDLPAWGTQILKRDKQLREFWPTEPVIAGAIQTIVAARSNLSWTLNGPPRTVGILQRMLQSSNLGKGWLDLQIKVCTDLLTQDNGAFVEIIRQADKPNSPVLNLAHLDSWQCVRTGMPETPVLYYDRDGVEHKLKWYQVMTFEDMPSPIERMNGLQVCFLSRILRAAQTIKDFGIYKREKIAGRNPGEIHLVSGVQTKLIEDKLQDSHHSADNQGYTRFQLPAVIGSLDPNANVNATTISLRNVPDGFDEDTTLRWYIAQIAMAAGADYQDFAPLPSGNIGTGTQSDVLDRKSKGKGQETWRKLWEHKLNFSGIFPQSVDFSFDEKDIQADQEEADLNKTMADTFNVYYDKGTGILPLNVIHQMMSDAGILKPEYLAMLGETDATTDIVATDDERSPTQAEIESASGQDVNDAEVQPQEVPAKIRSTQALPSLRSFWPFDEEETKRYFSKDSNADIHYGCLMLMMPNNISKLAMGIAKKIDVDDLHEIGIEDECHVTVKYGFHDTITPESIKQQIQGLPPFEIQIKDLSLFENDEFDVLKLNVEGSQLRRMNAVVSQLPNADIRPVYNPHLTIAYLKPGAGKKYLELPNPLKDLTSFGKLVFSDKGESHTTIQDFPSKKKQIDTSEFQEILAELMLEASQGLISRQEFIAEANALVSSEVINAYLDASDKAVDQLTSEDLSIIEDETNTNLDAIPNLYDASVEFAGNENIPLNQLITNRVALWGSAISGVFALGLIHHRIQNTILAWRLGPTDHCETCLNASELVLTRRQWRELGVHPQGRMLDCKGYRCQCSFEETDESVTEPEDVFV